MRLICPNCSAQYEIDVSLIPDEGRDVQCSNCGHTWFELPPAPPEFSDAPLADVGEDEVAADAPDESYGARAMADTYDSEPETDGAPVAEMPEDEEPDFDDAPRDAAEDEHGAEAQREPEIGPEPDVETQAPDFADEPETGSDTASGEDRLRDAEPEDEPSEDKRGDGAAEPSAAARAIAAASEDMDRGEAAPSDPFAAAAAAGASFQKRRAADDATMDILREEAERELAQRRTAPTTPLETQTDMEFDEVQGRSTPSRALRARMARERPEESAPKARGRDKPTDPRIQSSDESYEAPRRDLLPDIDEINSSLKARKGRPADPETDEADRRRGFRTGFLLMILVTILLIFAYAWAPMIAGLMPALEGPLLVYVDWANAVRDWIDGLFGA